MRQKTIRRFLMLNRLYTVIDKAAFYDPDGILLSVFDFVELAGEIDKKTFEKVKGCFPCADFDGKPPASGVKRVSAIRRAGRRDRDTEEVKNVLTLLKATGATAFGGREFYFSENADTEEQEQPIFAPIKQPKQPKQPQQAQSAQQAQPTGNPYVGNPYASNPYVGNPYLSSAAGANIANTNATNNAPMAQTATDKAKKSPSVGAVIGWIFFTLLIGIPVMAVIVSVIASLAAVFISGIAVAVAGAVFAVASLFFGIFGVPASGIFASLGLGLAASGVGILLAIGFSFATKYTAVYTFKGVRWLYAGRKRQ